MATRIVSWDWREQPDFDKLAEAVFDVSGGTVHVRLVDTDSDQYAITISTEPLDAQDAKEVWDFWGKDE